MSIVRLDSHGDLEEFFDALEFVETSSSEIDSDHSATITQNPKILYESDSQNLNNISALQGKDSPASFEQEPGNNKTPDRGQENTELKNLGQRKTLNMASCTSAFSPVIQRRNERSQDINRGDALKRSKSDSLRNLLSNPGGNLSTAEADPIQPPPPSPSPKIFSQTTTSTKHHAKKSSKKLKRSLSGHKSRSSPPPTLQADKNLSEQNERENIDETSPNAQDIFVGRTSPLVRSSVLLENVEDDHLGIEVFLKSEKENKKEYVKPTESQSEFVILQSKSKGSDELSNEDEFKEINNISPLEQAKPLLQSEPSSRILSADAIEAAEIAALQLLSPSNISKEIKQKQLNGFRRLKNRAKKTIKYGNKFSILPPTTPIISPTLPLPSKKDYNASRDLPANSVPVKSNFRKTILHSSSNPMLLLQTLQNIHEGPIWSCSFSPDGEYFATGGADHKVHVWKVNSVEKATGKIQKFTKVDKHCPSMIGGMYTIGSEIKLFSSEPVQSFTSHTGDIVDLSWSPYTESENFLLSASTDKTVKLWHISKPQPLLTFQHSDLVTSVDFHPTDENYFLSAGFDKKIRLWSIPKERVHEWSSCPEIITQGRFSPDGKFVVAGLITGQVYFFSCILDPISGNNRQGLRYFTQVHSKKKNQKSGKKVTGLNFLRDFKIDYYAQQTTEMKEINPDEKKNTKSSPSTSNSRSVDCLLVTTNDSNLRLFSMDDFCMIRKYKGTTNTSFMVNAHFSESGESEKKI